MAVRVTVRHLLIPLAIVVWAYGLVRFVDGDEIFGGMLILVGGVLFVVTASRGWSQLLEGLLNWLWGIGR